MVTALEVVGPQFVARGFAADFIGELSARRRPPPASSTPVILSPPSGDAAQSLQVA